jgi:hypothetical protein
MDMHGVIETPTFLKDAADAGISEEERLAIIGLIAKDPRQGDLMQGTGGARKVRVAGRVRENQVGIALSHILRPRTSLPSCWR